MKHLIFIFTCILFVGANLNGQVGFYFVHFELGSENLNVGRAKVYSSIFSANTTTDKEEIKVQFNAFLENSKPDFTQKKYFKKRTNSWTDVKDNRLTIYGPFGYSEAHNKLRTSLKTAKSRDWLTLKLDGFSTKPSKVGL